MILAGVIVILFVAALSYVTDSNSTEKRSKLNDTIIQDNTTTIGVQNQENKTPTPPPEFPVEYIEVKEYLESLSETRKKLAHKLQILIDQDYPVFPGQTAEQLKKQFVFVPAGETNKLISEEPVLNDTILVEVDLTEDTNTHTLDPYIIKALYRDEIYHDATVWVEVNNLEKLASLEGVKFIKPVYPELSG